MSQTTRSRAARSSTPTQSNVPESTTAESIRAASPTGDHSLIFNRLEEKKELQHLNDRLATYITSVRAIQTENEILIKRLQTSEDATAREVTGVKVHYEKKLEESRRQVTEITKARAAAQIDLQKTQSALDETLARSVQLEKEASKTRARLEQLENELRKIKTELSETSDRAKKSDAERNELSKEVASLTKANQALQDQLRKETLARIDKETQLQEQLEKTVSLEDSYREQLSQSRISRIEIEEQVTRETEAAYSQRLGDELTELRAESDEKLKACRAELESQYEVRIANLEGKLRSRISNEGKMRTEMQTLQSKLNSSESLLKESESTIKGLKERVVDLEKMLTQERECHSQALKEKENEVSALSTQIQDHLQRYKGLLDVKIALDFEIATYRKLVEAEELRSGSSSLDDLSSISSGSVSFLTPLRSAKRKRHISEVTHSLTEYSTDSQTNEDVAIEIIEHDPDGKFVRIENKSDKDISMSNWQVVRKAGEETITYKFHRNVVFKVNSTITIWSHNVENVTHNPPSDLVMKTQIWPAAPEMSTVLLDNSGKEVAARITRPKTHKRRLANVAAPSDMEKSCCIQ